MEKEDKEEFNFMEKALTIFENQDPNFERYSKVATSVRNSFQCYRITYDKKKKNDSANILGLNSSINLVIRKKTSNL